VSVAAAVRHDAEAKMLALIGCTIEPCEAVIGLGAWSAI